MMHHRLSVLATLAIAALLQFPGGARAGESFDAELEAVREAWAVANYQGPDCSARALRWMRSGLHTACPPCCPLC